MQTVTLSLQVSIGEAQALLTSLASMRRDAEVLERNPIMSPAERAEAVRNKISAIKLVRERLGCSLTTAKDIVEKG